VNPATRPFLNASTDGNVVVELYSFLENGGERYQVSLAAASVNVGGGSRVPEPSAIGGAGLGLARSLWPGDADLASRSARSRSRSCRMLLYRSWKVRGASRTRLGDFKWDHRRQLRLPFRVALGTTTCPWGGCLRSSDCGDRTANSASSVTIPQDRLAFRHGLYLKRSVSR